MSKVQQFELVTRDSGNQLGLLLDLFGLKKILGAELVDRVSCQKTDVYSLEWHSEDDFLDSNFVSSSLRLGKFFQWQKNKSPAPVILDRAYAFNKSLSSETLMMLWIGAERDKTPLKVQMIERYRLKGALSPGEWDKVIAVLKELAALNIQSPLYDYRSQWLSINGHVYGVDRNSVANQLPAADSLMKLLIDSPAPFSHLKGTINFVKPSTPGHELKIKSIDSRREQESSESILMDKSLEIVLSLPKRFQQNDFDWSYVNRYLDSIVSVYAQVPTYMNTRVGYCPTVQFSVLGQIPLLKTKVDANLHNAELYIIGPWASTNHFEFKLVSDFLKSNSRFASRCILLEESENWIFSLFNFLKDSNGFQFDNLAFEKFYLFQAAKTFQHMAILFFGTKSDAQIIEKLFERSTLDFYRLGSCVDDGKITCEASSMSFQFEISSIKKCIEDKLSPQHEGNFTVPDTKSTTFGYDRAVIYPDQYMLKITNIPFMKQPPILKQWQFRSSTDHAQTQRRKIESNCLNSAKLFTRSCMEIVSYAQIAKTLDINPLLSGHHAVDLALRNHLCQGSSMEDIKAEVFISLPHSQIRSMGTELKTRMLLLLEGIYSCCVQYEIDFLGEKISGYNTQKPELYAYVKLKSFEAQKDVSWTFPGFRLDGEAIVSIGPRPPFVDAGSRILNHVRVISNYLTELDFEAQLKGYNIIKEMIRARRINCLLPVGPGGIAEALFEMAVWGERGVLLKTMVNTIELFSGAPGRILLGVGEHELANLMRAFDSERILSVGTVSGDRVMGFAIGEIHKRRYSS